MTYWLGPHNWSTMSLIGRFCCRSRRWQERCGWREFLELGAYHPLPGMGLSDSSAADLW